MLVRVETILPHLEGTSSDTRREPSDKSVGPDVTVALGISGRKPNGHLLNPIPGTLRLTIIGSPLKTREAGMSERCDLAKVGLISLRSRNCTSYAEADVPEP
jgi:hypothetical protein